MAQQGSYPLCTSVSTVANTSAVTVQSGGRYTIEADGTTFPTTCQVQKQMQNGSWASVGSNITAAGVSTGLDLSAGQYRVNMSGGTAASVSVMLVRIVY